jgi:putative flippase GtrA
MSQTGAGGASARSTVRERLAPHEEKLRFLVVGGWNTLFSYGMLWVLDGLLHGQFHYTVILTLNWVIGVTQNLFTFKLLVFRTKGNWLKEYLRSYVVYAGGYVASLAITAAVMEIWHPLLGIAALPAIVIVTLISWFGHKYFTYRTGDKQED